MDTTGIPVDRSDPDKFIIAYSVDQQIIKGENAYQGKQNKKGIVQDSENHITCGLAVNPLSFFPDSSTHDSRSFPLNNTLTADPS